MDKPRSSSKLTRLLGRLQDIRGIRDAWSFLKWLAARLWQLATIDRKVYWWNLRSSMHSGWRRRFEPQARGAPAESPPVFDLRAYNPVGWRRVSNGDVAALGQSEWLPPGFPAHSVVRRRSLRRIRSSHHLEDVQAFHPDLAARARDLVRLAAAGVLVHLADADRRMQPLLGDELYRLMTTEVAGITPSRREMLSIRMRRAAMRNHSLWARTLAPKELPRVSILLVTNRPEFLAWALDAVARQTYPNLELVLALHSESFGDIDEQLAELPCPVKVLRPPPSAPLGAVLNAAADASSGPLLTKMDDDDLYSADHLWDLVLAKQYSNADLVGKFQEFVYLLRSDRTINMPNGNNECYQAGSLAGGTLLISKGDLARAGGWRNVPRHVDKALSEDVVSAGGKVYRTHGTGFMLVRHGKRHTWSAQDDFFLAQAARVSPGWNPALADIEDLNLPYPALTNSE